MLKDDSAVGEKRVFLTELRGQVAVASAQLRALASESNEGGGYSASACLRL